MNKLFTIGVGVIVLVALLVITFFFKPTVVPSEKTIEEEAYNTLEQEIEEAVASITTEDIENALLP